MAATATLTFNRNRNRNSILLSSPHTIAFPVTPSPAPSTSSSSASSTSSHTSIRTPNRSGSLGPPSHRRIRFAPLPDPRRDGDDSENGLVEDIDVVEPLSKRHSYPFIDDESCSSSAPSDTESLPPSLCTTPVPTKPTTQQLLSHTPIPAPSWSRPKSLSLLRPFPFKKSSPASSASSSHSLTPTPSLDKECSTPTPTRGSPNWSRINFSAEEILTLGAVNLFRPSSRGNGATTTPADTPASPPSSWGLGLTRWSSAGSAAKVGSPLGRTQSTQSYTSASSLGLKPAPKTAKKTRSNSTTSAPTPTSKSTSLPARKGTRMLNGRVYGGPKRNPDANPFANARDDDPEFVEWGYGGMGSVRGARHAGVAGADAAQDKERTRWERLHSNGRGVVVGSFAEGERKGVGGVEGVTGDDGDDGSGMGWVKKRREAREREKKEREEKEKAEAEAAKPSVPDVPTVEETAAPAESAPEPVPEPPVLTRLPSTSPSVASSDPEHFLKTVTLPAHLHHHSHRRTQSRTASAESGLNAQAGELSLAAKGPAPPSGLKETTVAREEESPSESESESETEGEDGAAARVNQEEDEEDEEEDEEEAEQEEARKTALGAGVEKISRHNN